MMLRQETCRKERKVPVTPPLLASNTGLEIQYLLMQTGSDLSGQSTLQVLLSPSAGRQLQNCQIQENLSFKEKLSI
jgi:hypothetical protein